MFIDDQGIVLRVVKYDERSSVVNLFTRSHGTVPFMVTRPRSRLSAGVAVSALMAPMNVISMQWDQKPCGTLYRMRDVHATEVWQSLPYHPQKRAVVMLLTECLAAMLREEGENAELFDHVTDSLHWFDQAADGFANFHLVFLLRVARALGIAPDIDSYDAGYLFDIESATFVPYAVASPYVLQAADARALHGLSRTSYDNMAAAVPLSRTDRARMLNYLNRFFIRHLPTFPALKSPEVLDVVFND